ncbi:MAG TPA: DUF6268 family outer membrane beta-barrel protein, partial [Verrucomicrobiae bacterium]
SHYDFSGADLWNDVHTLRVTPIVQYALNKRWTICGGPSVGVSGESGATIGDSFTWGGVAGARYQFSPTLTLGAGVGILSQIEDDITLIPVPLVDWQINDQWNLNAGFTEVASAGGVGAEINYRINERWSMGGGAQFQKKRFRLASDGPVPDGVGEDTSVPVYAKIAWRAGQNATFELVGGVSAGGNLRVEDQGGHKLRGEDYDPSGLVGMRLLFKF